MKHGEKFGEVMLIGKTAFVIRDLDAKDKQFEKAAIKSDGSLGSVDKSSPEDLEKSLANAAMPNRATITPALYKSLQDIFGMDVEVLVTG